jgi:hypothetical protein
MATLVLGTIGRAIGGPIGGIVGSLAGSAVDRRLFSSSGRRADPPQVQSAAYGSAIVHVFGRMRVAGNLIWSGEIAERPASGGKATGSGYTYTASFAVALSARPLLEIGRIWADGRLVRDKAGHWLLPITMRLHHGHEDQAIDPLLAAAETMARCPVYAGLAYVVFEDLPLADFGNRIPNLTFEVIADVDGVLDFGRAAKAFARGALEIDGAFPVLEGIVAAQPGSLEETLAPLIDATGASLVVEQETLVMRMPASDSDVMILPLTDCRSDSATARPTPTRQRLAGSTAIDVIEIGFFDPDRDYLAGLQRVRHADGHRSELLQLPVSMSPSAAKALGGKLLAEQQAARLSRTIRLPWRYLAILPGAVLQIDDTGVRWRVRERQFEAFVLTLQLERLAAPALGDQPGDGGRTPIGRAAPMGPTTLEVLDLPSLGNAPDSTPRLLLAGAGATAAWRPVPVLSSDNAGADYAVAATLPLPSTIGWTMTALPSAPPTVWDHTSTLEVEVLGEQMWLEGLSAAAVLQGGNLAIVGNELIQFADVQLVAPRRFRLRHLLRGRRGTEAAIEGHSVGERFVLLHPQVQLFVEHPLEQIGRTLLIRPAGPGDTAAPAIPVLLSGRGLHPLSPVHLNTARIGDNVRLEWIRRSRAGYAWLDFVDAPLAEVSEAWRIEVWSGGTLRQVLTSSVSHVEIGLLNLIADDNSDELMFRVAQLSEAVGPGDFAELAYGLNA